MSYRDLPGPSSIMYLFSKNNIRLADNASDEIFYMKFPLLSKYNALRHRVFTRRGGISGSPFKSLNASYTVEDLPENVDRNLQIIKENIVTYNLLYMNQVHGTTIASISRKDARNLDAVPEADVIMTDMPSLAIMVKQADCQGIILFDPVKSVVSVVHSGWRGSAKNILGTTVNRMSKDFNCLPKDILASIGPSLGPCCGEFKDHEKIFPPYFQKYMREEDHFDFWAISKMQLINEGLQEKNIEVSGICTKCNTDLFFSYRGEGKTGRFATVAMIK